MKVPASRAFEIARLESNGLRQRMEGVSPSSASIPDGAHRMRAPEGVI